MFCSIAQSYASFNNVSVSGTLFRASEVMMFDTREMAARVVESMNCDQRVRKKEVRPRCTKRREGA